MLARIKATPAQLREVFNQNLGYRNFNDFLHHYRVDEAAQRLLAQDLPILSIALDVAQIRRHVGSGGLCVVHLQRTSLAPA